MDSKNPIQSAERIFQILEYLADKGSTNLMDLSKQLNLQKSTVHRMLSSLSCMGYVTQDSVNGKYQLTFKILALSQKYMEHHDYISLYHPFLKNLAEKSGETVHLVQRTNNSLVYLDKIEPLILENSSIRMASRIGMMAPIYCTGVGKAILADLPKEEIQAVWEQCDIEKKTPYTITGFPEFMENLDMIRKKGYSIDDEENELGIRCVAASISPKLSNFSCAFSVSGPTPRMPDERLEEIAKLVLDTREQISENYSFHK